MKRALSFFLIVFILFLSELGFSKEFDEKTFDSPENTDYSISLYGPFSSPGVANPNDTIFTYRTESKRYPMSPEFMSLDQYKFTGRTGEKTFELEHIYKLSKFYHETIKMYFEENATYPLQVITVFSGCEKGTKIDLKMLKLTGSQLELQINLPGCLKK